MVKRCVYKTLGMLGQMYEEDGETESRHIRHNDVVVLACDYDDLAERHKQMAIGYCKAEAAYLLKIKQLEARLAKEGI